MSIILFPYEKPTNFSQLKNNWYLSTSDFIADSRSENHLQNYKEMMIRCQQKFFENKTYSRVTDSVVESAGEEREGDPWHNNNVTSIPSNKQDK